MIEHKVNVEVLVFKSHTFLPCHETETSTKFKQELLEVVYQGGFQSAFTQGWVFAKPYEFQEIRVSNIVRRLIKLRFICE